MSTNCIVKKYKVEVNDNNLPFYGYVKVYFDTIESASNLSNGIRRYADMFKDGKVEVVGDVYFANSSLQSLGVKELKQSYIDPFYVTNGKGVLLLNNSVQQIQSIAGAGSVDKAYYVKLDEFSDITTLTDLNIARSTKSEGDISNLSKCLGLTGFSIPFTNIEGDIINIACITGITHIDVMSTNCKGNLSDFAISQIDNYGRSSGSVEVRTNSNFIIAGTRTSTNGKTYTINYVDSTHFNIVAPSYTISYTKSSGVWSYEETT